MAEGSPQDEDNAPSVWERAEAQENDGCAEPSQKRSRRALLCELCGKSSDEALSLVCLLESRGERSDGWEREASHGMLP